MQLFLTATLELVAIAFTLLLAIEFSWGIYECWQDVAARTEFAPSTTLWSEYHQIFLDEDATATFGGVVRAVTV